MNVGIKGFGAYAPEKIIDNAYFRAIFRDTSDEWISKMTGTRRHWAVTMRDCWVAYEASLKAMADAGIEPEDIDMIIVHSNWRYAISNCREYVARHSARLPVWINLQHVLDLCIQ